MTVTQQKQVDGMVGVTIGLVEAAARQLRACLQAGDTAGALSAAQDLLNYSSFLHAEAVERFRAGKGVNP